MMHSYLKTMGIDTWTLRHKEAIVLPACYAYELFHDGNLVGVMFAAATAADSAVEALLQKMMIALKCEWRGQWFPMQPDCSELAGLRFVIGLGDGLDLQCFSVPVIRSYAPQQLIAEPKCKAKTWQSLQAVFSYLGSGAG